MSNAVAERQDNETGQVVHQGDAIFNVIERAARDPNVDMDKFERLMAMQETITARNAKAAYFSAFADMQGDLPVIEERGQGHGNITYALWEDVNEAIRPVLQKHGFGLSFRVGRSTDKLTVTGVLTHRDGHFEETTIELPADTSGSKNSVQAIGSSTSYGKRYTSSALLNLTSRLPSDRDDDGNAAGRAQTITEDQVMNLRELVQEVGGNESKLCQGLKINSLSDLLASRYDEVVRLVKNRKREG